MNKDKKLIELKNLIEAADISLQQARNILVNVVGTEEEKILADEAKKTGMVTATEDGQVIEGVFDGQNMVGPDGKKYSVPANYASKSKLVEGDGLKLTITPDGSFVYKQINLLERDRIVGKLTLDEETSEFRVLANNESYKVLSASITYFKGETGDKAAILVPKNRESSWAAVENIFKEGEEIPTRPVSAVNQVNEKTEDEVPAALAVEQKTGDIKDVAEITDAKEDKDDQPLYERGGQEENEFKEESGSDEFLRQDQDSDEEMKQLANEEIEKDNFQGQQDRKSVV